MKWVLIGAVLVVCGGFTIAFLGALLEHKRSWWLLLALFFLILAASHIL